MNKVQYAYDHAAHVIDNLDKKSNATMEFITSIDISNLVVAGYTTWDSIDNLMKEILFELSIMKINVKEKNGTPADKYGKTEQKFRDRLIEFDKLLLVYHNRHIDGSIPVNPHFHIIFDPKTRVGKNFIYLRQALEKLALLFNVQFHFMMESRQTGLSKKQETVIEIMATTLQRGTADEIATYLEDEKVYTALSLLEVHYEHSHNLSYFLKQMSILNKCLRDIDMDLLYKDLNLKNEIFFYLTPVQFEKLMLLKFQQNIQLDLTEILDREILKCVFGFESVVMKILKDEFVIEEILKENITYAMPDILENKKQKTPHNSGFRKCIQQDIRNALSVSTSFYRFRKMMYDMEYSDIKVKRNKVNQHKRKETGFELKTKKHNHVEMNFSEIGLSWSRIMTIFANNKRRRKQEKIIESQLRNYNRKANEREDVLDMFIYEVTDIFKIKYGKECKFHALSKPLLEGFKVQFSEMYNITTYISEDIVIVDYPDSLEIKKCNDVSLGIDLIRRFLPENISIEKLDITYEGSKDYINDFEKKMKENVSSKKVPKKYEEQRVGFKL